MTTAAVVAAWLLVVPVLLPLLATSLPISLDPRQPQWMEYQQGQAFADINTGGHREPDSAASAAWLLAAVTPAAVCVQGRITTHHADITVHHSLRAAQPCFSLACMSFILHHCPGCTT